MRPAPSLATGAFSITHSDLFSFTANPACLARLPSAAAGVYAERPYLLPELNQVTMAAGIPAGKGRWGVEAMYMDTEGYHEIQTGIAYGRSFGEKLDLGVQLNYHSAGFASGYGSAGAISADAGALLKVTGQLYAGIILVNPMGVGYRKEGMEKLPAFYSFGLGYTASDRFHCSMAIVKEAMQAPGIETALQYRLMKICRLRAGLSTLTRSPWMGIGFLFRRLRVDLSVSHHPQLGITPGMLLLIGGSSKKMVNGE